MSRRSMLFPPRRSQRSSFTQWEKKRSFVLPSTPRSYSAFSLGEDPVIVIDNEGVYGHYAMADAEYEFQRRLHRRSIDGGGLSPGVTQRRNRLVAFLKVFRGTPTASKSRSGYTAL